MINPKIKEIGYGFATYPSVKLYSYKFNTESNSKRLKFVKELLFGDYVKPILKNGEFIPLIMSKTHYIKVKARGRVGYIENTGIQVERVLEVNFIDAGQGDSCHIVTPDDKHFLIDAGKGSNMVRFLSWRFNLRKPHNFPPPFTAIVTHSDADHYTGFTPLLTQVKDGQRLFSFKAVYHNGIVEGSGRRLETLGKITEVNGAKFLTSLINSNADYQKRRSDVKIIGNYIKMLDKIEPKTPIESLKYGSPAIYKNGDMKIEVLGPYSTEINGQAAFPVLENSKSKTKNGHSIILKLSIGKLKLLLGGDLNSSAEHYLFKQFTGINTKRANEIIRNPKSSNSEKLKAEEEIELAVKKAKSYFAADIAKCCHHGSPDFTNEFLRAVNPIATVISSGDEESYCHPRPDTLGTIGKFSRGERPLIFSTELARSTKEFIETNHLSELKKKERLVTVYGMINVRTDGDRIIIAQKLEKPAAQKNWDIHKLEWNEDDQEFQYLQFLKRF